MGKSKLQLAVRSIHLHIYFWSEEHFGSWKEAITKLTQIGTNLQNINISLDQSYVPVFRGARSATDYAEDDEERWTEFLECLDQLASLPLRTATFIISNKDLYKRWIGYDREMYYRCESKFRWTLEQKRAWAKDVKDTILHLKN